MSEKVFPASKPTPAPATALPVSNGAVPPKAPMKFRPPNRAQPYNNSRVTRSHRSKRSICCCCLFWVVLLALVLLLFAVIAGSSLYVLYRPHRPFFTIRSLHLHRFNLTSSPEASSHLSALFNMTITSRNPNSHITFTYEKFSISALSSGSGILLGNGTMPAFSSMSKNVTTFRNVIVSTSADLDADAAAQLKGDIRRKADGTKVVPTKLLLDTKVIAKAGKLRSKRVGIRVTCDGIRALAPSGRIGPTVAAISEVMCKVDLRIKIWKFTF